MKKILSQDFFDHRTLDVARNLLGKFIVRQIGKKMISGMITEVEAYVGPKDRASHASRGSTKRTKTMFGKPGNWYVYLIYGVHHCLNVVTENEGYPAAVLIRGILHSDQRFGQHRELTISGPGRVCKYFKIDGKFNAKSADKKTGLWIEDRGIEFGFREIKLGKRIGVDYADKWKDKLWRFYIG